MERRTAIGIIALSIILLVATGTTSAFGDFFGKGFNSQSREQIRQAVETGDYDSWKEAMSEMISEENFNNIVEGHKAMSERRGMMQANMEEVQQALEAGDYDAWKSATESSGKPCRMAEMVTEENFDTFVKMHQAQQNGDWETANALAEELGIERPGFGHRGFGKGPCKRF